MSKCNGVANISACAHALAHCKTVRDNAAHHSGKPHACNDQGCNAPFKSSPKWCFDRHIPPLSRAHSNLPRVDHLGHLEIDSAACA